MAKKGHIFDKETGDTFGECTKIWDARKDSKKKRKKAKALKKPKKKKRKKK